MSNKLNTNTIRIDDPIILNVRKVVNDDGVTYKVDVQHSPERKKDAMLFLEKEQVNRPVINQVIGMMKKRNLSEIDMPLVMQEMPTSHFDKIENLMKASQ